MVLTLGMLAGSTAWGAEAKSSKASAGELKRLEGSWILVTDEVNGFKTPEQELRKNRVVYIFKGGKMTCRFGGVAQVNSIKLYPGQKPKRIDTTVAQLPMNLPDQPRRPLVLRGIYELDGDTLRICEAMPGGNERPKEFRTTAEGNSRLVVLKRMQGK
jgi:uncharacterized protein (TIGR03067 family)